MDHVSVPPLVHPFEFEAVSVDHRGGVAHRHAPPSPVAVVLARQALARFAREAGPAIAEARGPVAHSHIGALREGCVRGVVGRGVIHPGVSAGAKPCTQHSRQACTQDIFYD